MIVYECDRCKKVQRTALSEVTFDFDSSRLREYQRRNLLSQCALCDVCVLALNSWWPYTEVLPAPRDEPATQTEVGENPGHTDVLGPSTGT